MTQDGLENKREALEDLEKSEKEAQRLEEALGRSTMRTHPSAASLGGANGNDRESEEQPSTPGSHLPPHPGPNPARRRTKPPGTGFLNALSYTLSGMMDADPETARRNGISKTRENISQVRLYLFVVSDGLS